ncbi:hypothetical protein KI387_011136, partial [Taxus chinensis]
MRKEMVHAEAHCAKFVENGVGEIVHFVDYDDGVLQNRVNESFLLEDLRVGGFNGGEEILQIHDQCVGGFKQKGVEDILQFHDRCVGGFKQNGVEEILWFDDRCVGSFKQNGFEEILQLDDEFIGGFKRNGVEKLLQLDDRCVGGFQHNGVEKDLQLDGRCVGGFQHNGVEKDLQLDDRCVGGFQLNDVEEISWLDDTYVEGFEHDGEVNEISRPDDPCVGGVQQSGVDDHCVGGLKQNVAEEISEVDDQCFGGFNRNSAEGNAVHSENNNEVYSENNDEDQHISEFKEDGFVEGQELIALDNCEDDAQIVDKASNGEVFIKGKADSEELVACADSCVEQNALIASGIITDEEKHFEVDDGLCFQTDYNVEVSLESARSEEKGLGRPASEDMIAVNEESAPEEKVGMEDIADVTEDTVAIEYLNIGVEDRNSAEYNMEDRKLVEDLDIAAVEGSFVIEETFEIEDKENALDKILEELESRELEELCTIPNNDQQVYELIHDLCRNTDEDYQICGLLDNGKHDFSAEKLEPGQFKVAERIRDLKQDLLRLQFESVSEESTSKSSGSEQRNSTMSRESELEDCWYNPPVPASLGHGCNTASTSWDALYGTYTERMQHFDVLNNYQMHAIGFFAPKLLQKSKSLRLTSSFRQLSARRREAEVDEIDYKLQKEELETIYVAQTCLTWEALRWQYKELHKQAMTSSIDGEFSMSYDQAAEQFEQFRVLLQRFLENEPFNQGTRIQVYARNRSLMPKLLQVPALKALPAEGEHGDDDQIQEEVDRALVTASELMSIMEGAIMSFLDFLKADKDLKTSKSRKHQNLLESTDSTLLHAIKKCLEK